MSEMGEELLLRCGNAGKGETNALAYHARQSFGRVRAGKRDPEDAVGEGRELFRRRLECQARLSRATNPDNGDEAAAGIVQERRELRELLLPAHEGGSGGRKVVRARRGRVELAQL